MSLPSRMRHSLFLLKPFSVQPHNQMKLIRGVVGIGPYFQDYMDITLRLPLTVQRLCTVPIRLCNLEMFQHS